MYPPFSKTDTALSIDVLSKQQAITSSFFVMFGLFRISASTFVCKSFSLFSSVLLPALLPTLLPTSLMKLNGMVTVMSLSEKSNALSSYSVEIAGILPPVFSSLCTCRKISDNLAFTGTEWPRKKPVFVCDGARHHLESISGGKKLDCLPNDARFPFSYQSHFFNRAMPSNTNEAKFIKLEAYTNFLLCRWSLVSKAPCRLWFRETVKR